LQLEADVARCPAILVHETTTADNGTLNIYPFVNGEVCRMVGLDRCIEQYSMKLHPTSLMRSNGGEERIGVAIHGY
jgi:hypothetical protein